MRVPGPLQVRCRALGVADGLDLTGEPLWVLLGGIEPIPTLVGLQGGFAEVAAHLGRRDRRDDAALGGLVGQFVRRPVGDGPAGLLGGLSGDGQDLSDLLGGEFAGGAGAGFVAEDPFDGPSQDGARLAALQREELILGLGPTPSPASDLATCQADLVGDVLIAEAIEGQADDGGRCRSREETVTDLRRA